MIQSCWNGDQRSSLLQYVAAEMEIKGLHYFNLELLKCQSRASLLQSGDVEMSIKVFSTLIWSCWNVDQGLLYLDLEMLKCQSRSSLLWSRDVEMPIKVFTTLIWSCRNVDLRLLYFNLNLLKCQSKSSLLWSWSGMLKCWSRAFILWSRVLQCWSRAFLLRSGRSSYQKS